jgi:hypothetical protein
MIKRKPELQSHLDRLAGQLGFISQGDAARQGVCVRCRKPVGPFRDETSRREHAITGFCQTCQDEIFVEEEDDE